MGVGKVQYRARRWGRLMKILTARQTLLGDFFGKPFGEKHFRKHTPKTNRSFLCGKFRAEPHKPYFPVPGHYTLFSGPVALQNSSGMCVEWVWGVLCIEFACGNELGILTIWGICFARPSGKHTFWQNAPKTEILPWYVIFNTQSVFWGIEQLVKL